MHKNKLALLLALSISIVSTVATPLTVIAEEVQELNDESSSYDELVAPAEEEAGISAEELTEGDFTYCLDGDNAVIKKYKGAATNLTIPDKLGGHTVTAIDDWAFFGLETLSTVSVPATVSSIKEYAFASCTSLVSIILPEELNILGQGVFQSCKSLKSVTIGKNISTIPENCFFHCSNLAEVTFASETSVKVIGNSAFSNCAAITVMDIPDSVETIGDSAFYGCSSLKRSKLPAKITKVNDSVYFDCTALNKLYIPAAVNSVGDLAFCQLDKNGVDVYYGGSEEQWKKITFGDSNKSATEGKIHYNSTVEDYNKDGGKTPETPDKPENPVTPSENKPGTPSENAPAAPVSSNTVVRGDASITYGAEIVFPGKKYSASNFGTITISYNGKAYTAAKVKINKKNKTLQITKITPADKKAQKAIKKLTKGDNALQFKITPYAVSSSSAVTAKVSKSNELKKVTVDINGSKYKCGKDEYSYEQASKTITFKGENLTGSYTLK
ncbi:MAG: leucine-rich repeat domain-containing protein [Lachnospiraceae bacterium]|nr:leucine-rich repeat domain-containing protein [Lachnospiraceae bacterium]